MLAQFEWWLFLLNDAPDQQRVKLAETNWGLKYRQVDPDIRFPQYCLHCGRPPARLRRMASNKGEVSTTTDK